MAKLESSFKNMLLVLTSITVFAAFALGSVYELTKAPIEASRIAKKENAIKEVLPTFDRLDATEEVTIQGLADPFYVYKAYAGEEFVGAAVQSYSKNGFSGDIKVMVGFDKVGNIYNYAVLEQKETPGLGTKMVDWFKEAKGHQNIRGLNGSTNKLSVSKDGGEIDAITAATISSRAFLETVQFAYVAYEQNSDCLSPINQEKAIKEVLPTFDRLDAVKEVKIEGLTQALFVYRAYANNEFIGAAVLSCSTNGYNGKIKVMVGFDPAGNIYNYTVLEHQETEGLGAKMVDWFKTNKGQQDIRGLNAGTNTLTMTQDGGKLDGITNATVSSRAFLEAVRSAYSAYSQSKNGL